MKINVLEIPNCTWELEDGAFYCTHDEFEVVEYTEDRLGFQGHYQTESKGYQCAECEESLEGSPEEDALEAMIDAEIEREAGY